MNNYNKSSAYSTSSYDVSVPTPMSSNQQLITSECSNNMVPPTNFSLLINENTKPVFHVPQRGNFNSLFKLFFIIFLFYFVQFLNIFVRKNFS